MLFKHRVTTASIPDGLMEASVDLTKGMIVARKLNAETGKYEIVLPESEGADVYGFVTLREDEAVYKYSYYDKIEKGKKAVVYTLVKDHEWRTDQFAEGLQKGDKVCAGTDGKLMKYGSTGTAIGEVIGLTKAMAGYENACVIVKLY